MAIDREFWEYLDRLVLESSVVIDRPKGMAHPRFSDAIYPLDYGYLDGTTGMDGGGVDVWLGSRDRSQLGGIAVTVDLGERDAEIKLFLGCTPSEVQSALRFHRGYSMRAIFLPRVQSDLDWITGRRSVRRFEDREVPRAIIDRILGAAIKAPSAHNRQPWRFAVLQTRRAREKLAEAMGTEFRRDLLADGVDENAVEKQVARSWERIVSAPAAILLSLQPDDMDEYPDETRRRAELSMAVQSVAMAGQNLLLAAHAQGLGAVWVCAPLFAPEAARRSLDLPDSWQPQGLILIGYPENIPVERDRLPLASVTCYR